VNARLGAGAWKRAALQLYRVGVLVAIALIVRQHHVRLRVEGDQPLTIEEVRPFFPGAARLQPDDSPRAGLFVLDTADQRLGYVARTSPFCDDIVGYCGSTDTMVALDLNWKVLGIRIRRSEDTRTHVGDVKSDRHFVKTWNGMTWDQVAAMNLKKARVEGVSGATMTSMGMAESITRRFRAASREIEGRRAIHLGSHDIGLFIIVGVGIFHAFSRAPGRRWTRRLFQCVVIGYLGFYSGDLLAQSLLAGWARAGVPWHQVPGLALLAAAALVIPSASGRPLYCLQLCPHGAAQEWIGRLSPPRWRLPLPRGLVGGLRTLPGILLALVLATVMLGLPVDLAAIEPFDAYIIRSAGWATIIIAIVGLAASAFVPQAYCKFGCPTGALLEFVRSNGPHDRFGRRDVLAAFILTLALLIYWKYSALHAWLLGPN
jgi:NosR/NirI family nitrous oxide reductase transcriptional regulator